jgi:hypothetical protein
MKLRAAWGQSGRAPGTFDAVRTWNALGYGGSRPQPRNLGNPSSVRSGPANSSSASTGPASTTASRRTSPGTARRRPTRSSTCAGAVAGFTAVAAGERREDPEPGHRAEPERQRLVDQAQLGPQPRRRTSTRTPPRSSTSVAPALRRRWWLGRGRISGDGAAGSRMGTRQHRGSGPCTERLDPNRACFEHRQILGPQQPTLVLGVARGPHALRARALGGASTWADTTSTTVPRTRA